MKARESERLMQIGEQAETGVGSRQTPNIEARQDLGQ